MVDSEPDGFTLRDGHYDQGMSQLAELQEQGFLCDVTLVSGDGQEVTAHKVVLAARIPYFKARFDSGLFSSDEITLDTIQFSVLQSVISYCYKGSIRVDTWVKVCEILVAADYLQLETLKHECELILKKELCVENCVELCNLSNTYSCSLLKEKAAEFAGIHWSHVTEHDSWVNMNKGTLQELVLMDQLNTSNEESVLNAVLAWVKHDKRREPHLPTVLTEVRLPLLSTEALAALEQDSSVVNSKGCQRLLREAKDYRDILNAEILESGNKKKRFKLRERAYFGNSIYIFGHEASIDVYSGVYKTWSTKPRVYAPALIDNTIVVIDQVIYVLGEIRDVEVGPEDEHHSQSWFCSYHPSTQRWELENNGKLPNDVKLSNTAAASVKDCILLVGGRDAKHDDERDPSTYHWESLKCAHLYSPFTEKWQQVKDIKVGKLRHKLGTLHDKVYCVGSGGATPIADNEVYDVIVDEWKAIDQSKTVRENPALAVTDSRLVVFGGWTHHKHSVYLYTSEWYDPRVGVWQSGVDMPVHSTYMDATMMGDEIYLIGGDSVNGFVKQIYILDQRMEKWREGPVLQMGREDCYAVAIH